MEKTNYNKLWFPVALVFSIFVLYTVNACGAVEIIDVTKIIGKPVDRTGKIDASEAIARAIAIANDSTGRGEPSCVYIPAGRYRVVRPLPQFVRAGCVKGDGSSLTSIVLDHRFSGDLFSWSEAWHDTTPGPRVIGVRVVGNASAGNHQNAFVFYDRNDQILMDDIDVFDLPGRALFVGITKHGPVAYIRESRFRSLRFFNCGRYDTPAIEINSQGVGKIDGTNEVRFSMVDVYGSPGPGMVIQNDGEGGLRALTMDGLRIEGKEQGGLSANLISILNNNQRGTIGYISFTNLELLNPVKGAYALFISAQLTAAAPYKLHIQGRIGGGDPQGGGIKLEAARSSFLKLSELYTKSTNIVLGKRVSGILLDGEGSEPCWTYAGDANSLGKLAVPLYRLGNPTRLEKARELLTLPLSECPI